MLNKDLTQFMGSLSRVHQNQTSQRKAVLARWDTGYLVLSIPCFFDQFFISSSLCSAYPSPRCYIRALGVKIWIPRGDWFKIYWFQLFLCSQQLSNNKGCKNLVSDDCHISHVVKCLRSTALDHPIILISLFKHASRVSYLKVPYLVF